MSRPIVITGASSFVGCHLARAFALAGHAVTATHSQPRDAYSGIRAERLDWVAAGARLSPLDITDGVAVRKIVDRLSPALWVHHAGHATGYAGPDYDRTHGNAVNVAPLGDIYEAMAGTGGGILITGTNAEYADGDGPARESDVALPATPYGATKLAETRRAEELAREYGVPTRVGRLFIPFGHLDNPAKLLAAVVAALSQGRAIELSPCDQRRDFLGVGDLCRAWLRLAEDLPRTPFDIFNICSGTATELRGLLVAIAEGMDADPGLLRFGARPMRLGEPPVSFGSNEKARRLLRWQPRSLDRAIRDDLLAVPQN